MVPEEYNEAHVAMEYRCKKFYFQGQQCSQGSKDFGNKD
jgi:hypothetical protein